MKRRLTNMLSTILTPFRQNDGNYRVLFEQTSDAILICDSNGRIRGSNLSAAVLFGYTKYELAMMNIADLLCKRAPREMSFYYEELLTHKTIHTERTIRCRSSHRIPTDVTAQLLPDHLMMISLRDISERKKTEQTLRAIAERYDILIRATGDIIWDWDIVANTKLYDPGLKKIFGYDIRQVDNALNWINDKIHPDDLPGVITSFQHTLTNKLQHLQLEYRCRCADGSYKTVLDRSMVIYNANKNPVRMIGSLQAIPSR
jgi:PAS domain S-box-containing protein